MAWARISPRPFMLLAAGLLAALLFCPPARAGGEILLGVPTSLKTLEGRESFLAAKLAVEEINAAGGVALKGGRRRLKLAPHDLNDADPRVSPAAAVAGLAGFLEKTKPAAIVVGPFRSEVLLAAMDLLAAKRLPTLGSIAMSPVVDAKIVYNPRYKYIFRVGLNTKYLMVYLIGALKELKTRLGYRRVYILNQDVAWARSTASLLIKLYLEKHGWSVLGQINYRGGATDYRAGLKKARDLGAQVIVPIFDMPNSGNLIRQWRDLEVPALICGFLSPISGPGAWERFGHDLAGVMNVIFELGNVPAAKYPPASEFYRAYRARYGRPVQAGHGPAPAYESVYILARAMEKAGGVDPDRLAHALAQSDRVGAMGRIRFHRGHQAMFGTDPAKEALACVVQWTGQGLRRIVYPLSVAEGAIELPSFVPPAVP